jgi:hypothetical protein
MGVLRLPHHRPVVGRRTGTPADADPSRAPLVLIRPGWIRAEVDAPVPTIADPGSHEASGRWAA